MNRIPIDVFIVVGSTLWWLFLAFASRVPLSKLQVPWGFDAEVAIFVYFPICILAGLLGISQSREPKQSVSNSGEYNIFIPNSFFFLTMLIFLTQCLFYTPPLLSNDPSAARLTWGMKYLHVGTEIVVRFSVLVNLARVWVRGKIQLPEFLVIVVSIGYAFLVVSRGLILEFSLYSSLTMLMIRARRAEHPLILLAKSGALLVVGAIFFVLYGNWRQGSGFDIAEYGKMHTQNSAISWFFGYFLVNFDNLALLIDQRFHNQSISNIWGPLLQTLQIIPYEDVDNYLYVGKFNLGTAFRPFIIDFDVFWGGAAFYALWFFWIKASQMCIYKKNRNAIRLFLAYVGFCLPVTGRMEQPPYLFVLLGIFILDKLEYLKTVEKAQRSFNDQN